MAHHTVTLNYQSGFQADPDPVRVRQGDTLSFQLGAVPPNSKFTVKMQDPNLFSTGGVHDSQTKVEVRRAVSTKYHCQLLDHNGKVVAESSEHKPGGGIEPDQT